MARKEFTPAVGLAVASVALLGFIACGVICFNLNQTLKSQRKDLGETQAQTTAARQALEIQRHDLSEVRKQMTSANIQIAETLKKNQTLNQQLADLQSKLRMKEATVEAPFAPIPFPAVALDVPAADSVEGKLISAGKNWERAEGPPIPGGYVQDTLEGRLGQPKGRGRIGIVISMTPPGTGAAATVDFGHGYIVGIAKSELCPVRVVQPDVR